MSRPVSAFNGQLVTNMVPTDKEGQTTAQFHYRLCVLKCFQDPFINCPCEVVGKS